MERTPLHASRETGPARRIVCLTEEPTEILYGLGEGDRVVGISAWTERPPEAKATKPIVSAFTGGSVETIVALEPDLVIGFSDVQADLAAKLIRRNLPVLVLNQRSIREILDVVRLLGRIVGAADRAERWARELGARVEAARVRSHAVARRPRVYFEEWYDPLLCGSRWISELIEAAGGDDVFADRSPHRAAIDRVVRPEEVVDAAPDLILASWCGEPFDAASVAAREGWEAVPAVARGRVFGIESALILQPGPAALTDGLDRLEERIRNG
jgi:iron complex transport system substrate-binding protein